MFFRLSRTPLKLRDMLLLIYLNPLSLNAFMTHLTQIILHLQLYLFCHLHSLFYISFRSTDLLKKSQGQLTNTVKEIFPTTLNLCLMMRLDVLECLLITWLHSLMNQINSSKNFCQIYRTISDLRLLPSRDIWKQSRMELFHLKCLINI